MTHICVSKLTIIGSDNGLSPDRRQAIIWTNAGILLIGPLGTNLSEILIEILTFSFKKMRLKVSSAKRRPFCLGLNVLTGFSDWYYASSSIPVKQWWWGKWVCFHQVCSAIRMCLCVSRDWIICLLGQFYNPFFIESRRLSHLGYRTWYTKANDLAQFYGMDINNAGDASATNQVIRNNV